MAGWHMPFIGIIIIWMRGTKDIRVKTFNGTDSIIERIFADIAAKR